MFLVVMYQHGVTAQEQGLAGASSERSRLWDLLLMGTAIDYDINNLHYFVLSLQ